MPGAVGDQHAIAAGSPLPCSRHSLLDDRAPQIGIEKPLLRPRNRLVQTVIGNSLASRKSSEPSGFEYPQLPPKSDTKNYNTINYDSSKLFFLFDIFMQL